MKKLQTSIVASALLALGLTLAAPARGDDAVTEYVKVARSVFGGETTVADAIQSAAGKEGFADKVGELAATLSAVEVAKKTPKLADALAGIVSAVSDAAGDDAVSLSSRAAATVAAVTGAKGLAEAISDGAAADAAANPDSVLSGADKAALKDLYKKVLAALKSGSYAMAGDKDKANVKGKGDDKGKKDKGDKDKGGKDADAAAAGSEAAKSGDGTTKGGDGATKGGDETTAGGTDVGFLGGIDGGIDGGNVGDPVDQTNDDPYEFHATPTTLSGTGPITGATTPATPATPKPWKPKTTKPSPTPVGLH